MKRWLLKWLLDGDDVYVATFKGYPLHTVHTDFDGAAADMAGTDGDVHTATFRVD